MPLEELAYFQHTQSYSPRPPRSFPLFSAPNIKFLILLAVKKKLEINSHSLLSHLMDGHIDFFGIDEVSNSNCFTLIIYIYI